MQNIQTEWSFSFVSDIFLRLTTHLYLWMFIEMEQINL